MSESLTTVRLSNYATDSAVLALANALSQASEAKLILVEDITRVNLNKPLLGSKIPEGVRLAIKYEDPFPSDAYHALLPIGSIDNIEPIIFELTQYTGWATKYGAPIEGSNLIYYAETSPNWRRYEGPYNNKKWIVVLDDRLWRDLLITSMALNSETMRNPQQWRELPNALARYQLAELVRAIDMDEVLSRLDQIIAILQQMRNKQLEQSDSINELEPLLEQILGALIA